MGTLSRLFNFTAGTAIDSEQVDAEFNQILALLNGNLDSANLKDGTVDLVDLTTAAKNNFPKLLVPGDHKIAWGRSGTFGGFNAVGDISTVDVVHGLGAAPTVGFAIQANGGHYSSGVRVSCDIASYDPDSTATKLRIGATCTRQPIAPTVTADSWWFAIT